MRFKFLCLYAMYLWTAAFVSPLVISSHDFFFFLLARYFLMHASCVPESPYAFNDISNTPIKKK
jgi:hypothetical protein